MEKCYYELLIGKKIDLEVYAQFEYLITHHITLKKMSEKEATKRVADIYKEEKGDAVISRLVLSTYLSTNV